MKTSRDIKRIEAVSKSPIYSMFSASLPGLACIRANRLEAKFSQDFMEHLDRFHRPHFLFLCGSRWVGIRLDLLSNVIVTTVSLLLVLFRGASSAGFAGVVITQVQPRRAGVVLSLARLLRSHKISQVFVSSMAGDA